jgi:2-C-methyl-D-erythritol 4-phosphate cytidylyltransferase
MNSAIIVAAGSGSRFDVQTPKQFIEIDGKPVLAYTLERFERCEAVDEIVLVLAAERVPTFAGKLEVFGFRKIASIVPGGGTRAESVGNGLSAVNINCQIVAVHDGARPLVTPQDISRTIETARRTGAACLVAPMIDTIKHFEDGEIRGTLDRTRLRRALTPQAFSREILSKAFQDADLSSDVTDECYLVERLGVPIAAVEGSPRNIKITHAEDLELAKFYLLLEHHD